MTIFPVMAVKIVGGAGHTTETLRKKMTACLGRDVPSDACEAELFNDYLQEKHGLSADYLEKESTNCGNNITNLLALIDKEQIPCRSIILSQDAAMQRRMEAGLMLHRPGLTVVNYAVYSAEMRKNSSDARCGSSGGG